MSNRFSYVRYDEQAQKTQADFKADFEALEKKIEVLADGRAKVLVLTKLEEAYMWIGKSVRDDQIKRTGKVDEQPERSGE